MRYYTIFSFLDPTDFSKETFPKHGQTLLKFTIFPPKGSGQILPADVKEWTRNQNLIQRSHRSGTSLSLHLRILAQTFSRAHSNLKGQIKALKNSITNVINVISIWRLIKSDPVQLFIDMKKYRSFGEKILFCFAFLLKAPSLAVNSLANFPNLHTYLIDQPARF